MNMISQLRQRVRQNGKAEITAEEYDQLQAEWITRAGITEALELQASLIQERAECDRADAAGTIADELAIALQRMTAMHALMMKKVNHGASFYDAECLSEMNDARRQAARAIAQYRK